MNLFNGVTKASIALSAAVLFTPGNTRLCFADQPAGASIPSSQPVQGVPDKSPSEMMIEFQVMTKQINALEPPRVLADANKRAEFAQRTIPLLYRRLELIDGLAQTKQIPAMNISVMKQNSQAMLFLLEDAQTVNKVNAMMGSEDPVRKLSGKSIELYSRWLGIGDDKIKASHIVDEVEKLDRANPAETRLTMLTMNMAQNANSPALSNRLFGLVTDVMKDPYANRVRPGLLASLKADREAQNKQQVHLNAPVTVTGKQADGKDFDSSTLKGKVVLIDFWATWCVPCRGELPHLMETYNQYHEKGLEIVGVSNDYDVKDLQTFTEQNHMPWTELFDPAAGANKQPHPASVQCNVTGIPCMFLIDRQGICRSVTAWDDMDQLIPKLLAESASK